MKTSEQMKRVMRVVTAFLTMFVALLNAAECLKPRVIATTDGEDDDRSSMVRFLMFASDYDIAGIVQMNSHYQSKGHSSEKWIEKLIDSYAECYPNLIKHDPNYPTKEYLLSVLTVGNENLHPFAVRMRDFEFIGESQKNGYTVRKYKEISIKIQ